MSDTGGEGDPGAQPPTVTRRAVLAAGGAAAGTVVAGDALAQGRGSTGWSTYGSDAKNSAFVPGDESVSVNPAREWDLNVKTSVVSGITVADGTVYAYGEDGDVYALSGGRDVQIYSIGSAGSRSASGVPATRASTPAVVGGALYVGGLDGAIYAIDVAEQSQIWRTDAGSPIRSSPAVDGDRAYLGTLDGRIVAADTVGGEIQWSHSTGGALISSPAVAGRRLFVGGGDGQVHAIDRSSGEDAWRYGTGGAVHASPTLDDRLVYVGSTDGTVYGLPHDRGSPAWTYDAGTAVTASAALADGRLYVPDRGGVVHALDPSSGERVWTHSTGSEVLADPAATPSEVYVATRDGVVRALSRADGRKQWERELGGEVVAPLTVADGTLYAGTTSGHVLAVEGDSGIVATAMGYADTAVETVLDNGTVTLGAVGAGLASITGYAGLKRLRDRVEGSPGDTTTGRSPSDPTGSTDRIAEKPPTTTAPDLTDATYEAFDIEEKIGSGGSADVHRATIRAGDATHTVALKTPQMADYDTIDDSFFAEFVKEAEVWEGIDDHANVVSVAGWGRQPYPWIALEYMEAGNLDQYVGELPTGETLAHLEAICEGVHHAHRHGVTHTDLKPENVLFTDVAGRLVPKVTDWGLATVLIDHSTSVRGLTPAYAAPEQIEPEGYGGIDDRTDIYQLGVIAYELVTGERPFDRDSYTATMRAVLNETPTPPEELADVPPELSAAITTALATTKDERHETALHFRDALRRAAGEQQ